MAIHNCPHTFPYLTSDVLPRYMEELKSRMTKASPMSQFAIKGVGDATLLRQFGLKDDFEGCYVLIEEVQPVYVGISRTVFKRLRQHVFGTTHNNASLAYAIATSRHPHKMERKEAMKNAAFATKFGEAREYLRGLSVAFVEIANPLELYLFEVFCSMELDTKEWNVFETH